MTIDVARSSSPRASVMIATRSFDLTIEALAALADNGPTGTPFETIVVVNGADGGLADRLRSATTGVRVVESLVNRGLPGAANLARAHAVGDLLVSIHDDTLVQPGWMEALVRVADERPEAGAVGSKVLFPDGRLQTAGMVLFSDATTARTWAGEPPPPTAFAQQRTVDYCGTSSLLIRASVFDTVGGFDERFFPAYYVDVDMAMGVRAAGYVVVYEPTSVIVHRSGAARRPRWAAFVSDRNRRLFQEKWRAALERQPARDDGVLEAVRQAACRPPTAAPGPDVDRLTSESPLGDAWYERQARRLRDDFEAHLVEQLDLHEQVVADLTARLGAMDDQLTLLRASSAYELGSRLEFRALGSAHRFPSRGGYQPEDWGIWVGDTPYVIELPVVTSTELTTHGLALTLEVVALAASDRPPARVVVSVDGVAAATAAVPRAGVHRVAATAAFDASETAAGRRVSIQIHGLDPISPAAARMSGDQRQISVGLVALIVDAARPALDSSSSH